MPATPATGLIEKANNAQVTLQGDASLTGVDYSDVDFKYTASDVDFKYTVPTTNWTVGKVQI